MKVALGTKNDLKIDAAKKALTDFEIEAEIIPIEASSGVSEQPYGLTETITGAKNRAREAITKAKADLGIGIENGCIFIEELKEWHDIPCVCILTKENKESFGFGASHTVPTWMVEKIKREKSDLGLLILSLNGNGKKDLVEYFSKGKVKREDFIKEAIASALFKIINPDRHERN